MSYLHHEYRCVLQLSDACHLWGYGEVWYLGTVVSKSSFLASTLLHLVQKNGIVEEVRRLREEVKAGQEETS